MTVLMLQALAIERRSTGGSAKQETLTHHVCAAPDHVAHPLHAEHGIEDIERDHRQAVYRIGTASRHKRSHSTHFADTLLQNLPVAGFPIRQQAICIYRAILLTFMGVNTSDFEQTVHAKSASFIRHDGHYIASQFGHAQHGRKQPDHNHGGRYLPLTAAFKKLSKGRHLGYI